MGTSVCFESELWLGHMLDSALMSQVLAVSIFHALSYL